MPRKRFEERFPTRDSAAVQALAANVRRLRKMRCLSQETLAASVGIEQTAISHVENARANPTILVLEQLAAALGVPLSELLETQRRQERKK